MFLRVNNLKLSLHVFHAQFSGTGCINIEFDHKGDLPFEKGSILRNVKLLWHKDTLTLDLEILDLWRVWPIGKRWHMVAKDIF